MLISESSRFSHGFVLRGEAGIPGWRRVASFPGRRRESGAMLIVTMGVLTLLAVLGTTFVSLMRLEKKATRNYIDAQIVDLINESALDRIISDTRGALNYLSYTSYHRSRSPWLYKLLDDDRLAHGSEPLQSDRVGRWDILSEDSERVHRYKTKVIDCSSQININGNQDSLGRMLDNLAEAIVRSSNLNRGTQHPLWTGPNQTGERISGVQIIQYRNRLEGRRFRRKSELRDIIGEENYETIKDFITIHSWTDPYTYRPSDPVDEILDLQQLGGGGGRALGGGNQPNHPPVVGLAARLEHEVRAPVNINTAPEEVLVACLMGIAGRRPFPFSRLVYTAIDEGAQITGTRVPGEEEHDNAMPRAVWVYSQPLEYDQAIRIARRILEQRKNASTPFMTWSSGQASKPGFAEFINQLEDSFFPPVTTALVIDPKNLQDNRIRGEIIGGATPLSQMWRKGHPTRERQHRRQAGMPDHPANAFYFDLVKSAIISNFNPNSRISRYNPNLAAFVHVDKSDLVALDRQDRQTPRAGYTTEFCFDTMGVYEITTLGEIARRKGPAGAEVAFEPMYRKKQTTIAEVFGVIRHTNQFHFEQTFAGVWGKNSRDSRRYVVTWPDPMIALTDVVSQGSLRDGRIELAGRKDGDRAQMSSYSNILQSFRGPGIIMGWGGQDRDPSSYSQLRRLALSGAASTDYNRRLQDIWDADFHEKQSKFRQHYTRESLVPMLGGQIALPFDARAETEDFGSHLRPDGIHNSIINSDHIGVAALHLPAHGVIGQGQPGRVGSGSQVGAGQKNQNISGSVPYYKGGLAFWVKFDFDGDDPVFSGLIGCTQVVEDVSQDPTNYYGSEGSQFFIFKNTKGWLRIVRMYYHEAFPAIGGEGAEAAVSQLRPSLSDLAGEAGGKEQLVEYIDPGKLIARADLIVDVKHFRAHEWHHIAIDWNDSNPGEVLRIFVDFERVQGGGPFIPQEEISDLPTAWVRLNHRRPIDGLFVGGFIRHQGASDAGIFKWFTNTFSDSQGRGIRPIELPVKRILANATIDELFTFDGRFESVKHFLASGGSPGYFTNQTGVYTNVMKVPVPPEIDHIVMRSFDWTSYYPTVFWGNYTTRAPDRLRVSPIRCTVVLGRDNPAPFNEVWQRPNIRNPVAGRPVLRSLGGKGLKGRSAELLYEFRISPAIQTTGPMGGGSVATPVIDDVTATYFLPNPKILYQEEVD